MKKFMIAVITVVLLAGFASANGGNFQSSSEEFGKPQVEGVYYEAELTDFFNYIPVIIHDYRGTKTIVAYWQNSGWRTCEIRMTYDMMKQKYYIYIAMVGFGT